MIYLTAVTKVWFIWDWVEIMSGIRPANFRPIWRSLICRETFSLLSPQQRAREKFRPCHDLRLLVGFTMIPKIFHRVRFAFCIRWRLNNEHSPWTSFYGYLSLRWSFDLHALKRLGKIPKTMFVKQWAFVKYEMEVVSSCIVDRAVSPSTAQLEMLMRSKNEQESFSKSV